MPGFLDPNRLLQKMWTSANDLAMELFHQATQESPAQVRRPVELAKPQGKPALKIEYSPVQREAPRQEPPAKQPRQEQFAETSTVSGNADVPVDPIQGPSPTALQSVRAVREAAQAVRQSAPVREVEQLALKNAVEVPISRFATRAIASALGGLSSPAQVPSPAARDRQQPKHHDERPQFPPGRFVTSADIEHVDIPSHSQASVRVSGKPEPLAYTPREQTHAHRSTGGLGVPEHPDPSVDVAGPVVFRGPDPVQFAGMPMVYDRRSGGYVGLDSSIALQAQWQRWLTINAKVCWCDDTGVSAASLAVPPSTSRLGTGTVTMYQVDQDKDELQPIDDPESEEGTETKVKIYSLFAFPFKNQFALASMLGDHWFIFPFGSAVVATTRDGGIPAGASATCDLFSTAGGNLVAAGEAGIANDFAATVGEDAGTKIVAVIDTQGQLRAVAEDC